MKPRHILPTSLCACLMSSAPVFATVVYIDSFEQTYTGTDSAVLDATTGTSLVSSTTQTLMPGSSADAIGGTRTLNTSVSATVTFSGAERVITSSQDLGDELRVGNSLLSDKPSPPDHTTHKVTWTDISGSSQQLLTNVGSGSLADLQFIVRVDAGSNRDASYTANQPFDITLFSGPDTAGFRGVMTNADFISGNDVFVTLSLFGTADPAFNPNAVDKVVFQTTLAFTKGSDLGGGTPQENAVLIKQITAVPEVSSAILSISALGLTLLRRKR